MQANLQIWKSKLLGFIKTNKLFFICFSVLVLIKLVTGFNGLYGQDSHEYLRYTKTVVTDIKTLKIPGDYFWPVFYPLTAAILTFFTSNEIIALQLVSIGAFVLSIIYLSKILSILWQKEHDLQEKYLFLCFFLSPYLFRASFVVMSDMLCVFFLCACIYYFIEYRKNNKHLHFIALVFFAIAAFMTRYGAAVIIILPLLISIIQFLKSFSFKYFFISLIVLIISLLPHLLIKYQDPTKFIAHQHLLEWKFSNIFKNEFYEDGYAKYTFANIFYALSAFVFPGYLFLGIVFLPFTKFRSVQKEIVIFVSVIILYAIFLAGIPYQNMRFLLLSFPLIIIVLYPAFKAFTFKFFTGILKRRVFFISVFLINSSLIAYSLKSFLNYNKTEIKIANFIKNKQSYPVYTLGMEGVLQSYNIENKIYSLYFDKLNAAVLPSFGLVNEEMLETRYKNAVPQKNWQLICKKYKVKKINSFENGWQLYEIR